MKNLKIAGAVILVLFATALVAIPLEFLFGDPGKVIYGGICFVVGYFVLPWVITRSMEDHG